MNSIFLSEYNEISKRHVVLCDEKESLWMYLTNASSPTIATDCWICNVVDAPERIDPRHYISFPPPVIRKYLHDTTPIQLDTSDAISFIWSFDGENVALKINGSIIAYILDSQGHNSNLVTNCSWGRVFDKRRCAEFFETN